MEDKAKNAPSIVGESYELAGFGQRFFAYIIDGILLVILWMLILGLLVGLLGVSSPELIQFFALLIGVGYHWYFWTQRDGQTPGKFALGIRVIKADGTAISNTDAVIRVIGYQVSGLLCCLGYIWAIFDKQNQAWHDKLARTYVVRADGDRDTVVV